METCPHCGSASVLVVDDRFFMCLEFNCLFLDLEGDDAGEECC